MNPRNATLSPLSRANGHAHERHASPFARRRHAGRAWPTGAAPTGARRLHVIRVHLEPNGRVRCGLLHHLGEIPLARSSHGLTAGSQPRARVLGYREQPRKFGVPRRHPGWRTGTRAAAGPHLSCRPPAPELPPRHLGCRRGTWGAAAAPGVPRRGTRDVPGRHPRPAPELPARHPRPAPGVPARHPGPGPEVPARHPRCRHHTERKLGGRVDSPSRAQIAFPRWLHTPVGVPWR